MVSISGLHALTAELHAGFLTLAIVCILIVAAAQITVRLRDRLPKRIVQWAVRARGYAEVTSYVAATAGVLSLILSAWTGMYAWPTEKLLESDLVKNKILLTAFGTVLWGGVVFIRTRFGRGLWTCPAMAFVYVGTAVVAFGMIAIAGCLGSVLTRGESLLEPVYKAVGLNFDKAIELDPAVAAILALASAGALMLSLILARRKGLFAVELGPETCQKVFKWDEPKILEAA